MSGAPSDSGSNVPAFSVSELSQKLKRTLEDAFGHVVLRGEISGFKRAASGHLYFGLKDDKAVIDGIVWRGQAAKLGFRPEDGLEVLCWGRVTSYPARSKYQIVVERMEPAGEGALMALLEQRRRKLHAEGLFAPERKKPIPWLPETIGVVTSPTGAVIRDILHRLQDRFPRRVILWPVLVQGETAAEQVARAVEGFNRFSAQNRPDLLIVARGGGSIEDLWAFNEEIAVRAVAASDIPVISAVGHETDTTLIDHAADRRAPTPTAAAEMAVPVRAEIAMQIGDLSRRSLGALRRLQIERRNALAGLSRGIVDPRRLLQQHGQRLDDLGDALGRALRIGTARGRQRLTESAGGLRPQLLRQPIRDGRERTQRAGVALHRDFRRLQHDRRQRLDATARLLEVFSYKATLARGFAVVRDAEGQPLTRAAAIAAGAPLEIEFADGRRNAVAAGDKQASRPAAPRSPKPKAPKPEQGDLF